VIKNLAIIILALASLYTIGNAQGGSSYSALGIGDIRRSVGALYDAMSGTSIAMPTAHGINTVNPALLGMETTTRIQVGYHFNQHFISFGDQQLKQNNGKFDGLVALFSVDTAAGFGMSLGLLPFSSVNYTVRRDLKTEIDGQTIIGRSNQIGEGGSSMLQFGASAKLYNKIYIGASVSGIFGIVSHADQVIADGNYYSVTSFQTYDLRGMLFRAGVYAPVTSWLNVGAIISGGPNASVLQTNKSQGYNSGQVFYDTTVTTEISSGLPLTFGIGLNTELSSRSILAGEVEWSDYSKMTIGNPLDSRLSTSFRSSIAYSHNGVRSALAPYFERWGYHAGAAFQKLYVTYKGETITEVSGSVGLDFPVGGNAAIDVGLNAGWRGPSASNSLTEFIGRLTVTVSIGETWFKPFARE